MERKKDLTYKDEETGHILFGQKILTEHTEELKKHRKSINNAIMVFGTLFAVLILIIIWGIWYIIHTGFFNNLISEITSKCIGG